jgi:hypothetical protein
MKVGLFCLTDTIKEAECHMAVTMSHDTLTKLNLTVTGVEVLLKQRIGIPGNGKLKN